MIVLPWALKDHLGLAEPMPLVGWRSGRAN